jgi:DnaK suppressor protein
MALDTKHYKKLLLEKERELSGEIGRFEENVKDSQTAEVEDPLDAVTSSQTQAAAATEVSLASDVLLDVREALERIENGTYGKCLDCGRPIEEKRLKAVPWARYCLEDQQKHDKAAASQ